MLEFTYNEQCDEYEGVNTVETLLTQNDVTLISCHQGNIYIEYQSVHERYYPVMNPDGTLQCAHNTRQVLLRRCYPSANHIFPPGSNMTLRYISERGQVI